MSIRLPRPTVRGSLAVIVVGLVGWFLREVASSAAITPASNFLVDHLDWTWTFLSWNASPPLIALGVIGSWWAWWEFSGQRGHPNHTDVHARGADVAGQAGPPENPPHLFASTGETLIKELIPYRGNGYEPVDEIDYYIGYGESGRSVTRYDRLRTLFHLKLGEIALLRRLSVADNQTEATWRCEAALRAAGVQEPITSSMARMHDLGLVTVDIGSTKLTPLGYEMVWAFTQCLTHYPTLVVGYRQITPEINRTIRFDKRTLAT